MYNLFTIFKCQKCDTVLSNDKINLELIIWHSKCWWIKSYTVKLKELYILELNWEYQMKDDDKNVVKWYGLQKIGLGEKYCEILYL